MDFQFKSISLEKDHVGIVFCDSKNRLIGFAKKLDQISKKAVSSVINNDLSFQKRKSKSFDYAIVHAPNNLKLSKLYVYKLGDFSKYTLRDYQVLGGNLFSLISFYQEEKVGLYLDGIVSKGISAVNVASEIILGSLLASYRFDKYKTVNKKEKKTLKVKFIQPIIQELKKIIQM
jgi:leucyl aminopeptidase